MRLIIGGDICPIFGNETACAQGRADMVFNGLLENFEQADLVIANLECPLIAKESPIRKIGPTISACLETANILKEAGIHAVTLANNHIMDHGRDGLLSTMAALSDRGVQHFGAGNSLAEAKKALIIKVDGTRVGLLGMAHHEFSLAGRNSPGAAPMDPLEVSEQVRTQHHEWDVLVVLVHAGHDNYRFPSPRLQKYCHFLVDIGAKVVVCQHSHCPGTYEEYEGGLIVYGQGNLLFDWRPRPKRITWFQGFLVEVNFKGTEIDSFGVIPYGPGPKYIGVQRLSKLDEKSFIDEIKESNAMLSDIEELEREWKRYCESNRNQYYFNLLSFLPGSVFIRRVMDRLGFRFDPFKSDHRLMLLNLFRCEGHREVMETILKLDLEELSGKEKIAGLR